MTARALKEKTQSTEMKEMEMGLIKNPFRQPVSLENIRLIELFVNFFRRPAHRPLRPAAVVPHPRDLRHHGFATVKKPLEKIWTPASSAAYNNDRNDYLCMESIWFNIFYSGF
jgi:hypothetical protein